MCKKSKIFLVFLIFLLVGCALAADDVSKTLIYVNEADGERYHFNYYTDYGISRDETGELLKKGNDEILSVKGSYSYSRGSKIYQVTYVADENGYRAKTSVEPLIAMIPAAALASLAGGGLG